MVKCDYCEKEALFCDSIVVYKWKSYGMIYYCKDCEAWVGVHKGTRKPLGRLAKKELRELKCQAHFAFDRLWKKKKNKRAARAKAYTWLAKKLGIEEEKCHIGMFDEETCKKVIDITILRRGI